MPTFTIQPTNREEPAYTGLSLHDVHDYAMQMNSRIDNTRILTRSDARTIAHVYEEKRLPTWVADHMSLMWSAEHT